MRRAATLLELLVVIVLVAVLIGLLLPAIQRVRSAAIQASCSNNLRQLALALLTTHDVDGRLPPGMSGSGSATPYRSWRTAILPYLDQRPLWEASAAAYSASRYPFPPTSHPPMAVPLPVVGCPADSRMLTAWRVDLGGAHTTRTVALTSYLGSGGTDYRSRDGVLYRRSRTRVADITDGSSNTFMVGERPPSGDLRYGWWYAGAGQDGGGSLDAFLGAREQVAPISQGVGCPPGPYRFGPGQQPSMCDAFHFWSLHPGGANFAFCDGSVRFLSYTADSILPALATRAGGEVVDMPD